MKEKKTITKSYKELIFRRVPKTIRLLLLKLHEGAPTGIFNQPGQGVKFLTEHFGRLSDFPGIYVVVSSRGKPRVIRQSKNVLRDIQRFVRCKRNKDVRAFLHLGEEYGERSIEHGEKIMSRQFVIWIEVASEIERRLIVRLLQSKWKNFLIG